MVFKRVAAFLLAASIVTVPAFAHGHGGAKGHRVWTAEPTTYTVCPLDSCEVAGRHTHNNTTYCGYNHAHGFCDGTCYAVCTVEGCEATGQHVHNGVTYCGYDHAYGFCDGTCLNPVQPTAPAVTAPATTPNTTGTNYSYGYGHHGGGHHGCRW